MIPRQIAVRSRPIQRQKLHRTLWPSRACAVLARLAARPGHRARQFDYPASRLRRPVGHRFLPRFAPPRSPPHLFHLDTSLVALRNSKTPSHRPRLSSGSHLAPNRISTIARNRIISPWPKPDSANTPPLTATACMSRIYGPVRARQQRNLRPGPDREPSPACSAWGTAGGTVEKA